MNTNLKTFKVTKYNKRNGEFRAMKPIIIRDTTKDAIVELYAGRDSREYGRFWLLEIEEAF